MTVYRDSANGDQIQMNVYGDIPKIVDYIDYYDGDDLGNDLSKQSFVTHTEDTGVIMFAETDWPL